MLPKKRIKIIKKRDSSAGNDVYVKERSTLKLTRENLKLKSQIKTLQEKIIVKNNTITKQIEVLDDYREQLNKNIENEI